MRGVPDTDSSSVKGPPNNEHYELPYQSKNTNNALKFKSGQCRRIPKKRSSKSSDITAVR
jgi:hypothetical protein